MKTRKILKPPVATGSGARYSGEALPAAHRSQLSGPMENLDRSAPPNGTGGTGLGLQLGEV